MPSTSPNTTVTATTYVGSQTLFNATGATVNGVAGTDRACKTYLLHNRDASIVIRYHAADAAGRPIADGAEGGGTVPPGATIPISCVSAMVALIRVWTESGTPIVDGAVEVGA